MEMKRGYEQKWMDMDENEWMEMEMEMEYVMDMEYGMEYGM